MNTYRKLLNQEERYSQEAALMAEREQCWSQEDFEKFSRLVDTILQLRKALKMSPHYHPKGSGSVH